MRCQPAQRTPRAAEGEPLTRRCAFARRGLNAVEILACPGFDSLGVSYQPLHGGGSATTGFTCCHLRLSETQRGYAAVCGHPDGPFDQWMPPQHKPTSAGRR